MDSPLHLELTGNLCVLVRTGVSKRGQHGRGLYSALPPWVRLLIILKANRCVFIFMSEKKEKNQSTREEKWILLLMRQNGNVKMWEGAREEVLTLTHVLEHMHARMHTHHFWQNLPLFTPLKMTKVLKVSQRRPDLSKWRDTIRPRLDKKKHCIATEMRWKSKLKKHQLFHRTLFKILFSCFVFFHRWHSTQVVGGATTSPSLSGCIRAVLMLDSSVCFMHVKWYCDVHKILKSYCFNY